MSHKCIVLVNEAWTATSQGSPRLNNTQCTQNRSHNSNWCGWHFPILLEHICTVTWSCVSQLWLILSFCKWKFSRHKFMWIPVLSLQSTCYNTGPCRFFPTAIPKLRDNIWEMKVLIQALMVSVIAWVLPTNIYKVPLLLLGMKPQLFFYLLWLTKIWWNLCCWSHTHCKSHLQSHWVMAIFCCPGAFHTPNDCTQLFQQLAAHIYRPIQE